MPVRSVTACFLTPLLWVCAPALAQQVEPDGVTRWTRLLDTPRAAIAAHDLRWIQAPPVAPSSRDAFVECEAAVDLERLSYVGYRLPAELPPYKGVNSVPSELRHPYHVYRYGEFTVLTETDGRREQLCVFALARALELLRARLPKEYAALFVGPTTPTEQLAALRAYDAKKSVSFLNLTRAHVFVLKGRTDQAIAASTYDLGYRSPEEVADGDQRIQVGVFRNVATTYLNLAAIQGHRSKKLYAQTDLLRNFLLYLRDGLLETLVHEALHHLLRRDKNVRPLFWALTKSVRGLGGERLGKEVEEAFVSNVSTHLLEGKGLSPAVTTFYRRRFGATQRQRLGLAPGRETDQGIALQALLRRYRPSDSYEELFFFDLLLRG